MGLPRWLSSKESAWNAGTEGDTGLIPGWVRSQTHSSILAWKIPWTEEPGRPQLMELQRVRHDWATELNWTELKGCILGLPWWLSSKRIHLQCRRHKRNRFSPWFGKIPWRRVSQPTPVFLPGKSRGQRSLTGYSPQGRRESDTTEVTLHTHIHRKSNKWNQTF